MPFDVLPQETQVEVGPYQADADAMLRGCAVTKPFTGSYFFPIFAEQDERFPVGACALGAWKIGMGYGRKSTDDSFDREMKMRMAYRRAYGKEPQRDFDDGNFTREEIAARVAALR